MKKNAWIALLLAALAGCTAVRSATAEAPQVSHGTIEPLNPGDVFGAAGP